MIIERLGPKPRPQGEQGQPSSKGRPITQFVEVGLNNDDARGCGEGAAVEMAFKRALRQIPCAETNSLNELVEERD
jgi:hypothetical protein